MQTIYYHKSKSYYKQLNNFKFNAHIRHIVDKKHIVYNAINPYITDGNYKKKKFYITTEKSKELNAMLKKEFPYVYIQENVKAQGCEMLKVYVEHNNKRILVIEFTVVK